MQIHYLCSQSALDQQILSKTNLKYSRVFAWKIRRYFDWNNFWEPFLLVIGFFQALFVMIKVWPQVVFVKGGFASVPVALAAFVLRRPIVAHESDTVAGLANRFVAFFAKKLCTGFPQEDYKVIFSGNPVRKMVTQGSAQEAYSFSGFNSDKKVILVYGGSQGAEFLNQELLKILPELCINYQVIHISGPDKQISFEDNNYRQYEYLNEELFDIYQIADLAISRAGANSLAELAANKIPMILVPHLAGNNHQEYNANYYVKHNMAIKLNQSDHFAEDLRQLIPNMFGKKWSFPEEDENETAARRICEVILGGLINIKFFIICYILFLF